MSKSTQDRSVPFAETLECVNKLHKEYAFRMLPASFICHVLNLVQGQVRPIWTFKLHSFRGRRGRHDVQVQQLGPTDDLSRNVQRHNPFARERAYPCL